MSSTNGIAVTQQDKDTIQHDLEKIDRRLVEFKEEITADVRISHAQSAAAGKANHVVIELHFGRTHLIAKADNADVGQAVRTAREELLRQINDRKRGGHTAKAKGL